MAKFLNKHKIKRLSYSLLLLFVGLNMRAQSVATEQMDERFNEGTKLPFGWFTEGWTVKDGVIQTKSSSSGFDLEALMGNSKKEDPEDPESTGSDPEESPDDKQEENKGSFNLEDLLNSFMGGDSKPNYLLTPPLVVNEGESLVFCAKKSSSDNSRFKASIPTSFKRLSQAVIFPLAERALST